MPRHNFLLFGGSPGRVSVRRSSLSLPKLQRIQPPRLGPPIFYAARARLGGSEAPAGPDQEVVALVVRRASIGELGPQILALKMAVA